MRHQRAGRLLNRTSAHRRALLTNLVEALIEHERIRTTLPKAKEAQWVAEKMITLAKENKLHKRRLAGRTIRSRQALHKLFATIGPRFSRRPGGYTRIVKLGNRLGDAAPMAILELVERSPKSEEVTPEGGEKAAKTTRSKEKKESAPKAEPKAKKAKAEPHEKKPAKAKKPAKSKKG
jgi:large subunit ribosomal protein L17